MIIIVALHNAHIFRHKFILISINITHYCYCCVCDVCWFVFLVSRLFLSVTCKRVASWGRTEKNNNRSKGRFEDIWCIVGIVMGWEMAEVRKCTVENGQKANEDAELRKSVCRQNARGLPRTMCNDMLKPRTHYSCMWHCLFHFSRNETHNEEKKKKSAHNTISTEDRTRCIQCSKSQRRSADSALKTHELFLRKT